AWFDRIARWFARICASRSWLPRILPWLARIFSWFAMMRALLSPLEIDSAMGGIVEPASGGVQEDPPPDRRSRGSWGTIGGGDRPRSLPRRCPAVPALCCPDGHDG